MREIIRARDLLAAEAASHRIGYDAIISYVRARCNGSEPAISLWRSTIPHDWSGNTHINESRFVKMLRHTDAESLFKNIKTGIDLIEHYGKKSPSAEQFVELIEAASDDESFRKIALEYAELFFAGSAPHGNVGNKNASKGMNSHLNIRCNRDNKAGWVKQAQHEGLSLTEWVNKKLNAP